MLISDIFYVSFLDRNTAVAFTAKQIFFLLNTSIIFLWVDYIGKLIWGRDFYSRTSRVIFFCSYSIDIALVMANFFMNVLFRIDRDGGFVTAVTGMLVFTLLNYLSVAIAVCSVIINRKRIRGNAWILLLVYQIPVLLGENLAFVFRNISLVFTYCLSVVILLMVYDRYSGYSEIDRIIDDALEKNKFQVYYQPIYSCDSGKYDSCEALLRLYDIDKGFISPAVIIDAAEQSGKISDIGKAVFEQVCAFIASDEFKESGLKCVNFNLSVSEIADGNLASNMMEIINRYGVSTENICIEITETALCTDNSTLYENMTQLRNMGLGLALDDFGSGYSNLARMALLPFSQIKIDRTLVNSYNNAKVSLIVDHLVSVINSLSLDVVAEGIENRQQFNEFASLGCGKIQGFFFAKPLDRASLKEFLAKALDESEVGF